jgi:hypothetical protein
MSLSNFLITREVCIFENVDDAKIQFSPAEMDLMCNAGVLLTKNRILAGIRQMLEGLQEAMQRQYFHGHAGPLETVFHSLPKISRGDQYLGLPYLVLDYPRSFNCRDMFAVRTLFWWGHAFSSTLHLAGTQKEEFAPAIVGAFNSLAKHGYFIGVQEDDPWQHHFEEDNYRLIAGMDAEEFATVVSRSEHLKIAMEFPLRDVHFVSEDLLGSWKKLLSICGFGFE